MASITSVISFLILLLATYSYSAPTVTPEYEFTTGTIMVEHQTPANLILLNGKDSVSVPNFQKPRSFAGFDGEESTTVESEKRGFPESNEESTTVESEKRGLTESSEESTTVESNKRGIHESSEELTTIESEKRGLTESSEESSTLESNKRGLTESSEELSTIDPVKREFDEFSSSTIDSVKREFDEFSSSTVEPVKREFEDFSSSTIDSVKREFDEFPSSTVEPVKRNFFEYSTPDMETATTFNSRAIGEEDVESFDLTTPSYEEQPEGERHPEPSSSADVQAGQSGLLYGGSSSVYGTETRNPKPVVQQTIEFPSESRGRTTIIKTSQNSEPSNESSKIIKTIITSGDSNPEEYKQH